MKGNYQLKFPESDNTMAKKVERVAAEPAAYFIYKRRDLEAKVDKFDANQIQMANAVYALAKLVRDEKLQRIEYAIKKRKELEEEIARRKAFEQE